MIHPDRGATPLVPREPSDPVGRMLFRYLTPREEHMVRRLRGYGEPPKAVAEVAADFAVTPYRVLQIYRQALGKLVDRLDIPLSALAQQDTDG